MPQRAGSALREPPASLVEEIASLVRERIVTHQYAAGTWLRQERLSAELGVSRTPLRESLRLLEHEGLIQVVPGRGAKVVTGEVTTVLAAYEFRAVIDGLAARLTAERMGMSAGRHLWRVITDQRAACDPWQPRAYTNANVDFHEQVIRFSGNEFVIGQVPILRITANFMPAALLRPQIAQRAIAEHSAIVRAIEVSDGPEAERLARDHIRATIDRISQAPAPVAEPSTDGAP